MLGHLNLFRTVYTEELARAVSERPDEYAFPASDAPVVADRMIAGFLRGSASNNGIAIRRTCKRIGIGTTYKAISCYLNGEAAS